MPTFPGVLSLPFEADRRLWGVACFELPICAEFDVITTRRVRANNFSGPKRASFSFWNLWLSRLCDLF